MSDQLSSVRVYRIRDSVVEQGLDAIVDEKYRSWLTFAGEVEGANLRLYVSSSREKMPGWVAFLDPIFQELTIRPSRNTSALLLVTLTTTNPITFAFPFGFAGHHCLAAGVIEPQFGLKVALNVICGAQANERSWDPSRIGSVDGRTVSHNTLSTRIQTQRWAPFEVFGMDVQRDLVRSVTGAPIETEKWGTRITGADLCALTRPIQLRTIATYCRDLEDAWQALHYQHRFGWVDHLHHVTDRSLLQLLRTRLLTKIKLREIGELELAVPDLVDWKTVTGFRYSEDPNATIVQELDLAQYLSILRLQGKLTDLTIDQLKRHRLGVSYTEGRADSQYPINKCLSGEITVNENTYVVDDGQFFRVARSYLDQLNNFIDDLPLSSVKFPPSHGESEDAYNEKASIAIDDALLLDRDLVYLSTQTAGIEVCDILTQDGSFIHVKRGGSSATLSHLFSQGDVSARLLTSDTEFRTKLGEKIDQAIATRIARTTSPCSDSIKTLLSSPVITSNHEIVYAIIKRWDTDNLSTSLPLFSKINLRSRAQELRRMGYKVSIAKINVQSASISKVKRRPRRPAHATT